MRNFNQDMVFSVEILEWNILQPNSRCYYFMLDPLFLFLNHLKLNDIYWPVI
jgi:hypothetical protein